VDAITTAAVAHPFSVAAPSLHRPQRAAPSLAAYKATKEAALAADEQVRKAELEARMAALNATGPTGPAGPACNATTTFYYVSDDANVDLSPCHQSLTELVVLSVDFAMIAPQIKHMVNLQLLKIYYTWNTFLPEELADLKQLTRLETYGTSFNGWHELEVLQRMPQLRHLVLSGASLWYLPYWLGKLRNLEHLDVSYNNIYEIGDEIGGLVKLQTLIAPFSFVQSVSPRINRLTHLHHLDLRDSYYLRLPATLAELNELESVQLEGSYYPCVPDAVRAMPVMANTHYFDYTLSCAAVPQPIGYAQTRNDACLWDAYYGFWYKAACDGTFVG
jgi:Leucine-rich repeat (LRR) protein